MIRKSASKCKEVDVEVVASWPPKIVVVGRREGRGEIGSYGAAPLATRLAPNLGPPMEAEGS